MPEVPSERRSIWVHIKLEGSWFPNDPEFNLLYTLEDAVIDSGIGNPEGAGSGGGWMDFSFVVDNLEAVEVALPFILNLMKKYSVPSDTYRFEVFQRFDTVCDDLPNFYPGDCLCFRFEDGEYGAAIVLKQGKDAETNPQVGKPPANPSFDQTLVGVLNHKRPERPAIAVFEQRDWLLKTVEHSKGQPYLVWLSCFGGLEVEVIGKTDLRINDPMECRFSLDWDDLPRQIVLNNERDNPAQTIQDIFPVYEVGAGISYQFPDGEFGAALVLATSTDGPNRGETLLGVLDYKEPQLPSKDVFTKRNWLKVTREWRKGQPFLVWALWTPEDADFREIAQTTISDSDPKSCNLNLNWSDIPEFVLLECKIETKNN